MQLEKYVKKAKSGDTQSFEYLIKTYQDDLYRIAKSRINNEDDCIDIIQNTVLAAYESINNLKDNNKFKSWLFSILINQTKKYYSTKKIELSLDDNSVLNNSYTYQANDTDNILKYLNDEEKQLLIMFYVEGFKSKEIAEIMNTNQNTIKTKILRARKKLQEKLKEDNYEQY